MAVNRSTSRVRSRCCQPRVAQSQVNASTATSAEPVSNWPYGSDCPVGVGATAARDVAAVLLDDAECAADWRRRLSALARHGHQSR